MTTLEQRVLGCLKGVAIGDAIGKQTETLTRKSVKQWYPNGIVGFEGAPGTVIPRYVGNKKREWKIGETTDDTERTIAVAQSIIRDRKVSHAGVGREMLACRKSVHPGVESLWQFHEANDPDRIDLTHDGCGAAIRTAPVGMVYPSSKLAEIVTASREASISTHGGSYAIAAAVATGAAVSAAIDGASGDEVAEFSVQAAATAEERWAHANGPAFAEAARSIRRDLAENPTLDPDDVAMRWAPTSTLTIVPLALAFGTLFDSAASAILLAANVGGDSDSVASIAGAILGARHPETVNDDWVQVVETVNGHDLASLGRQLFELRSEGLL